MSRPLRIEYPGAFYHVINRGLERRNIFQIIEDYSYFLELLKEFNDKYGLIIHSYSLMPNHYHLYMETPFGDLQKIMRQLDGNFTQKFNKRHKRVGPLFQGRYKAILVDKESYSLQLSQYIHLNPVKANLTKKPEQYKWSSFAAFIGQTKPPSFLETNWILSQFHQSRQNAIKLFKAFTLKEASASWLPEKETHKNLILGNTNFVETIRDKFLADKKDMEIPQLQALQKQISPEQIEQIINAYNFNPTVSKKLIIYALKKYTRLTLKEIGERTSKRHYSSIAKTVSRMLEKAKTDKEYSQLISKVDADCKMSNVKT